MSSSRSARRRRRHRRYGKPTYPVKTLPRGIKPSGVIIDEWLPEPSKPLSVVTDAFLVSMGKAVISAGVNISVPPAIYRQLIEPQKK